MVTRRLILIRHAKAEAHGGDDAQRRLAPSGENDAREIGRWLATADVAGGLAVVSTARRAVQTWELAAGELAEPPRTVHDERIYGNTVEDLLDVIQATPESVDTLVLVGHNPAIQLLATMLAGGASNAVAAADLARNFPTSGIALLAVAGPWSELDAPGASLESFAVPRG